MLTETFRIAWVDIYHFGLQLFTTFLRVPAPSAHNAAETIVQTASRTALLEAIVRSKFQPWQ